MKQWWWLSFSQDSGWKGGAVVEAESFSDAIKRAWECGANPGGEVAAIELGPGTAEKLLPVKPDRLYSREQLAEIGVEVEKIE